MNRFLAAWFLMIAAGSARADSFDHYTNTILAKIPESAGVEKVKALTTEDMVTNNEALPGINATFVVVRTNDNRWARLLLQPARQKIGGGEPVPILLIERFTTFREGEERRVHAQGQNVRLFHNFRFNLDIGQVVPEALGGDLRFVAEGNKVHVEPVGKAEMYLVTKHLPEAVPAKTEKLVIGEKFEPRFFNGQYKLYDDGRRTGMLHLKLVDEKKGVIIGHYYSDKDGQKYDVEGRIGNPPHNIQFRIFLPRTIQVFNGFLFTGNGQAITGSSLLQERETGFYAERVE